MIKLLTKYKSNSWPMLIVHKEIFLASAISELCDLLQRKYIHVPFNFKKGQFKKQNDGPPDYQQRANE